MDSRNTGKKRSREIAPKTPEVIAELARQDALRQEVEERPKKRAMTQERAAKPPPEMKEFTPDNIAKLNQAIYTREKKLEGLEKNPYYPTPERKQKEREKLQKEISLRKAQLGDKYTVRKSREKR